MNPQEQYRSDIQFIDKDHVASMFMATCELNEVYDEEGYYLFLYNVFFGNSKDDELEQIVAAEARKIIQARVDAVWRHYWGGAYETMSPDERDRQIAEIEASYPNVVEEIRADTQKNAKKNIILNKWNYIGNLKVFAQGFTYHSSWSYNDVLLYFQEHGFPYKRRSVIDKLSDSLNVCKVRHILRNDIMTEEAILLPFIEMYERARNVEAIAEANKIKKWFMVIVSLIVTIVTAPFTGGQSGWLLAASIISLATSIASGIVGIVGLVMSQQQEEAMKEQTKKTNDLMLKNMPRSGNFVDTAITDPYAMYANGRLYKQGGAGGERYDALRVHEPYRYLDDKFGDSDMYDVLNHKNEKLAGGSDYLPNLYRDGKWCNPDSFKALLNGQIPFYLGMRTKVIEAVFKWLTKNDLGTYYLKERNPDDDKKWWDRYHRIEFEDISAVRGFTHIIQYYDVWRIVEEQSNGNNIMKRRRLQYLAYVTNVSTKWEKEEENKKQEKWNNITENNRVIFVKEETKVLKGSDVKLYWVEFKTTIYHANPPKQNVSPYKYEIDIGNESANFIHEVTSIEPYCDANTYYECTYKLYTYGGKEVHVYSKLNNMNLAAKSPRIWTRDEYIWEIRGELENVSLRFREGGVNLHYANKMFITEEMLESAKPYVTDYNGREFIVESASSIRNKRLKVYRLFDKKIQFGDTRENYNISAIAQERQASFIKTTIYYKSETTCFGLSNFLNAKRNITTF